MTTDPFKEMGLPNHLQEFLRSTLTHGPRTHCSCSKRDLTRFTYLTVTFDHCRCGCHVRLMFNDIIQNIDRRPFPYTMSLLTTTEHFMAPARLSFQERDQLRKMRDRIFCAAAVRPID